LFGDSFAFRNFGGNRGGRGFGGGGGRGGAFQPRAQGFFGGMSKGSRRGMSGLSGRKGSQKGFGRMWNMGKSFSAMPGRRFAQPAGSFRRGVISKFGQKMMVRRPKGTGKGKGDRTMGMAGSPGKGKGRADGAWRNDMFLATVAGEGRMGPAARTSQRKGGWVLPVQKQARAGIGRIDRIGRLGLFGRVLSKIGKNKKEGGGKATGKGGRASAIKVSRKGKGKGKGLTTRKKEVSSTSLDKELAGYFGIKASDQLKQSGEAENLDKQLDKYMAA